MKLLTTKLLKKKYTIEGLKSAAKNKHNWIRKRLGRGRHRQETFREGDKERIKNPKSMKWDTKGIVMRGITHEGGEKPVSYIIATEAGEEFHRNRKFLKLRQHDLDTAIR